MAFSPAVILSPGLDQSKAIAAILRRASPGLPVKGLIMPGEGKPVFRSPFDEIGQFIASGDIDTSRMIPTGSASTAFLLNRGPVQLGSATMMPEALRFYDKAWSLDVASQAGVPIPQTWFDPEEVPDFPVFYKSTEEGGGRRGLTRSADEIPGNPAELIFQEFISGRGTYGVGFVADHGRLVAVHGHYEIESYPELGGSAVAVERIHDPRLMEYTEALLRHTGFSGWGLVEFKHCPRRDDYVFMELNAKFWASCEFAFRNEPAFARLLFDGEAVGKPCDRMVFMHRAFSRGPDFMVRQLPALARGAELRFVPGTWQLAAARLALPKGVLKSFASVLRRKPR